MEKFAERFKALRKEKGLSTKALGKELNVNDSTITRWEKWQYFAKYISSAQYCQIF